MLERIDAMETELNALIESLRTGSNRLNADLQLLEGNLTSVKNAVVPRPAFEPEQPVARPQSQSQSQSEPLAPASASEPFAEIAQVTGAAAGEVAERAPNGEPAPRPRAAAARANGGDDDGARLIALNMALNGTPREETDRYLAENFKLTDRRGLLDEVLLVGRRLSQPARPYGSGPPHPGFPQTAGDRTGERLFGRLDSVMWTSSSSREPGSTTSKT